MLCGERKRRRTRSVTSKETVISTVDEMPDNLDSGLYQAATPLETTPIAANPLFNISGNYYQGVNATENSRVHLGNVYHYHGEKLGLKYVEGATFDAYCQVQMACHPATRVDLLRDIQAWAQRPDSRSIFWLQGMAGTGKSTISWTIANWLTNEGSSAVVDLGGSFFFKRGEGDRGSAALLFPTIVHQLVRKVPGLYVLVAEAIGSNPDVCSKSLGEQFRTLISQPLQRLVTAPRHPIFVIVIDALDECKKEDIDTVLQLWSNLRHITNLRLRLFLTSRPELPVQLGFDDMSTDAHHDMILHEVPRPIVQHDILAYLTDAFAEIRKDYNRYHLLGTPLDHSWPGNMVLQELTDMAVPLFIVAATIYRFVHDPNWDPQERVEAILQSRKIGQMSQMAQTYLPVLKQMTASLRDRTDEERLYTEFRTVVGSIVTLAEPLSGTSLAALLNLPIGTVVRRLKPLHSVLQIPARLEATIRPLHLSFSEFLTSQELQNQPFGVNSPATHTMLLTKCLELLSCLSPKSLCENMCNLTYPGQPRRDLAPAIIQARLSPAIQYACRYWTHHTQHSRTEIRDDGKVYEFLQKHFLHWLEALSLLDRLAEAIEYVEILQSLVSPQDSTRLSAFLKDARRFVFANRFIGDLVPLQLYSSAIIFAPQTSVVRKVCGQIPAWMKQCPITPATWSLELQKLEGHNKEVNAVAFSPDGSLLASASDDHTVRLWNSRTGQEVQMLEGHTNRVKAVAFSPDGSLLASASDDQTVRLWNSITGQEVQTLEGHAGGVTAVAFSPDGSLLASASWDGTVRLWNSITGQEVQTLEGHTKGVTAVAFSPDGSLLASASDDHTVRLWNLRTGQEVQMLEGHTNRVKAVAFSPDGSLLASASWDGTVRLWNSITGQEVQTLEGHTNLVTAVAFSPDGSLLASASYDQTVRLWNSRTGQEVRRIANLGQVKKISLTVDNQVLVTNQGRIFIDMASASHKMSDFEGNSTLVLKHDWIEHRDQRLLWLPQEYRSHLSAFHGSTLAIGHSKRVTFLRIEFPRSLLII